MKSKHFVSYYRDNYNKQLDKLGTVLNVPGAMSEVTDRTIAPMCKHMMLMITSIEQEIDQECHIPQRVLKCAKHDGDLILKSLEEVRLSILN